MYCCHSIPECYNLFSGVKLSVRSFCVISFSDRIANPGKIFANVPFDRRL